jgi:hypothetical protein
VADRALRVCGVFQRHGDDLNDLFGCERGGRPRSRPVGQDGFESFGQGLLVSVGFKERQTRESRLPSRSPEGDGVWDDPQTPNNLNIALAFIGEQHNLRTANERLRTAMATQQAFQAGSLKRSERNRKWGRARATRQGSLLSPEEDQTTLRV